MMTTRQKFQLHKRGLRIDFPNRWTVSVLTDKMYYADKGHAETAAWCISAEGVRVWLDADEYETEHLAGHVNPYQTPCQVAAFIQRVAKLKRLKGALST